MWFSSVNSPALADHLSQQCQTAMIYWLFRDSWAIECTFLTCREKGSLYRRGSFLTHEIKRQNRRDSETVKEDRWDQRRGRMELRRVDSGECEGGKTEQGSRNG